MRGLRLNALQDHDRIGIENGMLRLRKTSEKSFYNVWADAFYNYTIIFVSLFGEETPDLHNALAQFYSNVYKLSTGYE